MLVDEKIDLLWKNDGTDKLLFGLTWNTVRMQIQGSELYGLLDLVANWMGIYTYVMMELTGWFDLILIVLLHFEAIRYSG